MSEDVDLSKNVEEVKEQIRSLEDPDYQSLLDEETEGKDRKTIKEFLQKRIDDKGVEVEEAEDELVDQIEEETEGGLLGGFSRDTVLTAGIIAGIVAGLIFGLAIGHYTAGDTEISTNEAQDRLTNLMDVQPDLDDYEILSTERQNGMFYHTVQFTQEFEEGNETVTDEAEQRFYMTTDGQLLFPEQEQFGQIVSPINIDDEIQRMEDGPQMEEPEIEEELPEDFEEELEDLE